MYDPDKVDDYSKKELAEMIFNGEVSREQIDEDGLFLKHRRLLDVELSLMAQEEIDWTEATTKNTIGSYQVYLDKYNPTIVEGETVTDGWVENSAYIGHHIEEALRLQSLARKGEDDKKDKPQENPQENIDWAKAERADSIDAYRNYIVKYESLGGKHLAEAKQKLNQLEDDLASILTSLWRTVSKNDILPDADDKEWGKACKTNTITAYRLYLDKYDGQNSSQKGKYIPEANKRINKLMDEACWANAVKQNTNEAYQNYIGKYPQGIHLAEAHNRLRPPVPPKPILKYILAVLSTACVFFGWQYLHKKWPFEDEKHKVVVDTVNLSMPIEDSKSESESEKSELTGSISQGTAENKQKEVDSTRTTTNSGRNDGSSNRIVPSVEKQKKEPDSIKDYEELAKSGDTSAYAVLAKKYLNKNNYDKAAYWANKAWKANVNRSLAKEVIEYLSDIDYYVGAKYEKPY